MKTKIFLLIASVICLFSCSNKEKPKNQKSVSGKVFEFEAVTEINENNPDIYVVLKVMTSDYWQSIIEGVTDSGIDNNCNIYLGGIETESCWEEQERLLYEAKEKNADAVIFAPANSSAYIELSESLHDSGIPIVLVDTMLTSAYYDVCYMTDNFQAGELAASELLKILDEKYTEDDNVQVAMQTTTKNSQTVVDRIAGFNKYWIMNAPENWFIIDEIKLNYGNTDMAIKNGKDFLKEYPDIKVMVACNNSSAVGFAQAMYEENRNDIILSAFDYSDIVAGMIASDEWTATTIVQKQYDMGYNAVKSALDLINGKKPEYKFIDTGVMAINGGNYKEYESEK